MPDPGPEPPCERLLRSFLEDWSLSDAARSVALYAACRPPGHKLVDSVIAGEIGRPPERVRRALRELRRAGYCEVAHEPRQGAGPAHFTVLAREKVLASPVEVAGTPAEAPVRAGGTFTQASPVKVAGTPTGEGGCEHCRRPGHGVEDCDWLAAPLRRLGRLP